MLRIIHGADFHLDSPFSGLPPEEARQRRRENRTLPERLAQLAARRQADLVLLAGDLFDGDEVYPETLEQLRSALAGISCPVVIAPGNHDPYCSGSPYESVDWPENVHIFRESGLKALHFPALGCTVYGAAFTDSFRTDEVLEGFAPGGQDGIRLLCLHGDLDRRQSKYGPLSSGQLERAGFRYAALGHVHCGTGLQRSGETFWAYPGSVAGRGFNETGEKGVLVCTLEETGVSAELVSLGGCRYHILTADVTGREPRSALAEVLAPMTQRDICRVALTGEAETPPDLLGLETEFASLCCRLQLQDETRAPVSLWEQAGEDSLRGLFLRRLRQQYDAAEDGETRRKIDLAARFGLAALEGRDLG